MCGVKGGENFGAGEEVAISFMSMDKRLIACVLLLNALAACQTTQKPPFIQTISSTPTLTKTPTIDPTEAVPAGTMIALATMDAIVTKQPELGEYYSHDCMIYPCYVTNLGLSPDGRWAVFFNAEQYGGLSVVDINVTKKMDINLTDIIDCPCGSSASIHVEHWSKDGKYLYVSPYDGSEGGFEEFWKSKTILVRINLEENTWLDTKMGPSFSFSPNDKYIAYRNKQKIIIYDFQSAKSREMEILSDDKMFGHFIWSPDSNEIIFVSSATDLDEERPDGFTLLLLDIETMTMEVILKNDQRYLYPLEWPSDDTVLLESLFEVTEDNLLAISGEKYKLNPNTYQVEDSK
jgi:Tol biopolymer transport system component